MADGAEDGEEFREFALATAGRLFRIAYLVCGDWHEAQDLVQTTLAKLFVAWHRVQRTDSPDRYARKVLMNAYLSERRRMRASEMPVADPALPVAAYAGDDADLRLTLVAALRKLPPRSRAVVVLRHFDDYSVESVAQALGVSPAAVKSLNSRGLAQLRDLLGAEAQTLRS